MAQNTPNQPRADVLIVGAGIGGLTLALSLQRQGKRVRVFERAPILDAIGAGITLYENARRAYRFLGLDRAIDAQADIPSIAAIKDFISGETIEEKQLQKDSTPVRQLHRADFHKILADGVIANDPDTLCLGHEFKGLTQNDTEVSAHFTNGATAQGSLLVGGDGNRSNVRSALFGDGEAEFLNYVAWRGLVPIAALPAGLITPDTGVFFGRDRSFVRYKLRRGTIVNYVAFARTTTWTADSWMIKSSVADLLAVYADAAAEIRHIIAATPPDACFKWGLIARKPLTRWTVGRATLLGDAAHAMLPFLGQGAGMSIEDAIILARALATNIDQSTALMIYEKARIERTTMVMLGARHAGLKMHGIFDDISADAAGTYDEKAVAAYDPVTVAI